MKKIIVLFLIGLLTVFVITGCNGVTPPPNGTEGEGEGEGEGEAKRVVLVEAFESEDCANCKEILPHLKKLAKEYGRDEMILVQVVPWLSFATENGGDRWKWYELSGETPQILFNGRIYNPLTGAPDYATIKNRITALLAAKAKITIQATRTEEGGTSIIEGTIKNISSGELSNLVINCMTFRNRSEHLPFGAIKIFDDKKINVASLSAGESKDFTITLPDVNWGSQVNGVIFVQNDTGNKQIYQSLYIK